MMVLFYMLSGVLIVVRVLLGVSVSLLDGV